MVLSSVVEPFVPTFFKMMEAVLRLATVAPVSNLERKHCKKKFIENGNFKIVQMYLGQ